MNESMQAIARRERDAIITTLTRAARLDATGRADDAAQALRDELSERVLSIDLRVKLDVTLYTGGPAGGVEFDVRQDGDTWELITARVWHQDWGTARGYAEMTDDEAQALFDAWNLEYRTDL
jgi:hypothetical protein